MPPLEPPQNVQVNAVPPANLDVPVNDSEKRLSSQDGGEEAPPKKRTKVIDVQINGDVFDQSGVVAGKHKLLLQKM